MPLHVMDPLRLLSRSTKTSKTIHTSQSSSTPSNGQLPATRSSFGGPKESISNGPGSRKRKRGDDTLNFFSDKPAHDPDAAAQRALHAPSQADDALSIAAEGRGTEDRLGHAMPEVERKRVLKEHKVRVSWINAGTSKVKTKQKRKAGDKPPAARVPLFPSPLLSFNDLGTRFNINPRLAANIASQGLEFPTEVQLGAIPLLLDDSAAFLPTSDGDPPGHTDKSLDGVDLLTVAPTGSGKTLAFLIPLLHHLQSGKRGKGAAERQTSSIILAPTRELARQIVNEARKLAQNTGVRVTQMRKGMRFGGPDGDHDALDENTEAKEVSIVKADIVVSTPGVLHSSLSDESSSCVLSTIRYLVLDEADVLLDPLFREQTLEIWNKLSNPSLKVSLWSATMGSNIEELVQTTLSSHRKHLLEHNREATAQTPLIRLVVGLKDSAVPNVEHKLTYTASEQGKLMGLRQLLRPGTSATEAGPVLRPPFLVFTQTIERAVALHGELLYDIPAEAGGISRIAVLHSDLSDTARDSVMTRFSRGEIWVLITTDLLSRGVDFLGVNGVVNYDIPTSSAAYVHRIGRTGRAGRTGGVAVTLYSKEDIPYLKHIANVVAMAQRQKGEQSSVDQWLLDALPTLSKNEKKDLRKRGIQSRTRKGQEKDPKAARRSQISSKSGYDRRLENRRKGAAVGSIRASQREVESNAGSDDDFKGFD